MRSSGGRLQASVGKKWRLDRSIILWEQFTEWQTGAWTGDYCFAGSAHNALEKLLLTTRPPRNRDGVKTTIDMDFNRLLVKYSCCSACDNASRQYICIMCIFRMKWHFASAVSASHTSRRRFGAPYDRSEVQFWLLLFLSWLSSTRWNTHFEKGAQN